ncbi:MAG: guanylate kinase [Candidatus Eisenbacteria sp.]|nr:guanylate kinase [Candidatus Eisenbacteria bacterium]
MEPCECPRLIERPFPVVVSAPSGTGKTSVVDKLLALDGRMIRAMTATTRPARKEEGNGTDYLFLSEEEFGRRREQGYFAESAQVHGHWYGVPKENVSTGLKKGKWVVLNVDIQGGLAVKETYADAVLIFLLPPSMEALEERLRGRGTESEEEITERMKNAREEMLVAPQYQYVVVNDDIKACANRLLAIVWAETSRTSRGLVMPKD